MKIGNSGFAISSIMYLILIMAIILVSSTLAILSSRKLIIDRQKSKVQNEIYSICKGVNSSNKTEYGNIPTGEYNPGDEYICKVNDENSYHFYVLSVDDNNVNLILDHNILKSGQLHEFSSQCGQDDVIEWCSEDDFVILGGYFPSSREKSVSMAGPYTALFFMYEATESWTNIPYPTVNYIDEGPGKFKFINNNIKYSDNSVTLNTSYSIESRARLPYYSEVKDMADWQIDNIISCTGSGSNFYWTMSSGTYGGKTFYGVDNVSYSATAGIRPVISIPKDKIFE